MKLNKRSGFTLLEIIIVIIIVGVLASLALPRFFSTVEYSRSTEALNSLGVIRKSVDRCSLLDGSSANCTAFNTQLDIDNPGTSPGAHFGYAITITDAANGFMTLTATRNTLDGGNGGDTVVLTVNSTGVSRSGTGAFASVK